MSGDRAGAQRALRRLRHGEALHAVRVAQTSKPPEDLADGAEILRQVHAEIMGMPPEMVDLAPRGGVVEIGLDAAQPERLQVSERDRVWSQEAAARDVDQPARAIGVDTPRVAPAERAVRVRQAHATAENGLVLLGAWAVGPVAQIAAVGEQAEEAAHPDVAGTRLVAREDDAAERPPELETRDADGYYIYVRDLEDDLVLSNHLAPPIA